MDGHPELFRIEGLTARPAEATADILHGVDLSVAPGEVHAIMGPNGSGKSTLANTLLASPEYQVTGGRIWFKGDDITDWPTDVRAKSGMFLAFLDETDSGLDIDALRTVATGINEVRADRKELGVVLITHYQRLLDHVRPDRVHILVDGRIVESGGPELAHRLEREGYEAWRTEPR